MPASKSAPKTGQKPGQKPGRKPGRICIVSAEFNRLFRNGGIGTACTGLAQLLAEHGHEVTVLYTAEVPVTERTAFQADVDAYAREWGIRIVLLEPSARLDPGAVGFAARAFSVHDQLRQGDWDAIFFNDARAEGYYAVTAKRAGLGYRDTALCVVAHGPRTWVRELNHWLLGCGDELENVFMEIETARLADHLISPSRYMLDWLTDQGWELPASARVTKVRLPRWPSTEDAAPLVARRPVRELVFFGRLEYRKGLTLFCDAVDELAGDDPELRVTFLGKFGDIAGEHAGGYVLRRARRWPFELRFLPRLDQPEALEYLRAHPGALPVIPSLVDNLPCVVNECLQEGLPFVATDTGGIPELVAEADRARCLCAPTAAALAAAIRPSLEQAPRPANAAESPEAIDTQWLDAVDTVLGSPTAHPLPPPATETEPVAAVIVTDAPLASATARSIREQTHDRVASITVRTENDVAAARRAAIAGADTEYVLLLENGTSLVPETVATLLRAAQATGAAITTCLTMDSGTGRVSKPGLGNAREAGYCRDVFSGTTALVAKTALREAGLLDLDGFGSPMWSSYCEASFAGLDIVCVPEPLARVAGEAGADQAGKAPHQRVREVFERHEYRDCALLFDLLSAHASSPSPGSGHEDAPLDSLLEQLSRVPPQSDQALALLASQATRGQRFQTAFELHAMINATRTRPRTVLPVQPALGPEPGSQPREWEVTITRADMHAFSLARECAEAQDAHPFALVRVDEQTPAVQVHPVIGHETSATLPLGKAEHLREIRARAFLGSADAPPVEFRVALVSGYARLEVAASPWTRVDEPANPVSLSLSLPVLDAGEYDLVLSTRLPGERMSYAHARFSDIHLVFGRPEAASPDEGSTPA
jgi:glycosyltransferase involved in cell wall biosynthesis